MRLLVLLCLLFSSATTAAAQHAHTHAAERVVDFPDVPGYHTLVCDFHVHTVFSDGSVWPDVRIEESERDGLDCLAVTDHLEYQPHADDIPHPDRNRSYELAVEYADESDLIVLRGAEVTRSMPPGHSNAIFIDDVNPLLVEDALAAFREAGRQGGFIFWNHPHWTAQRPDGVAALTDFHRRLIDENLLHGIEVVNHRTYSDEALQIALDHDLTILGTSDIHGLVDWDFDIPEGGHRPVTLVFAEERSAEGIRAALDDRRTTVWYDDLLIGRSEHLVPLIEASVTVDTTEYSEDSSVLWVTFANESDAPFLLRNRTDYTFHDVAGIVTVAPRSTTTVRVKPGERVPRFELTFEVLNALTAPNRHPQVTWEITADVSHQDDEDGD